MSRRRSSRLPKTHIASVAVAVLVAAAAATGSPGANADAAAKPSASAPAPHETTPTAAELLQASDRARGGLQSGLTWSVHISSIEDGARSERGYLVKARATGGDALVETIAPARSKGELMLFNDRTIWYYKPGLRSPVSASARQRLSGQAANGDIASTNYARDYVGAIVGEDVVAGEPCYRLELKAKASNVTYDKLRYWITKAQRLAVKAEYLTLQGTLFKTALIEYQNKIVSNDRQLEFISRMQIVDAAFPENVTVIVYSDPRHEEYADFMFNVNNLVR